MHSELIVIIMSDTEDLGQTWRDLQKRHGGELLTRSDVALIRREASGKSIIEAQGQTSAGVPDSSDSLAAAFAGAIFEDFEEEKRSRLAEAGLDPRFLNDVNHTLKPECSAVLIYVNEENLIDTRRYLVVLGQLDGTLYHTIFRSHVEEALLK